jgi:ferredoxin
MAYKISEECISCGACVDSCPLMQFPKAMAYM